MSVIRQGGVGGGMSHPQEPSMEIRNLETMWPLAEMKTLDF